MNRHYSSEERQNPFHLRTYQQASFRVLKTPGVVVVNCVAHWERCCGDEVAGTCILYDRTNINTGFLTGSSNTVTDSGIYPGSCTFFHQTETPVSRA